MSSDLIARVQALHDKAEELADKGHLLRAAENFGRATEAARALGADNLVMLLLQLRRGNMLGSLVTARDAATVDPRILAAHRAEFIALHAGVVQALERRRLAGTLEDGKCAAAEEAWRSSEIQHLTGCTAAVANSLAGLVGYDKFMQAATISSNVLARARLFAAECSSAQFLSFAQHVVHAVELMQQPRRHGDRATDMEAMFTDKFRHAVAAAGVNGLDARPLQLLTGAWKRLLRSGVLTARHVEEVIWSMASEQREFSAAIQSSLTAPGLRSCALPGCGAKEAHPTHFKSCAACRAVVYCCREHQVAGWPSHKKACKAARKAAEAEEQADA